MNGIIIQGFFYVIGVLLFAACNDKDDGPAILEFSVPDYTVMAKGGTIGLEINSNTAWTLESKEEWCKLEKSAGSGTAKVEVKVETNVEEKVREGIILLKNETLEKRIVLSQEAVVLDVDTVAIKVKVEGGMPELQVRGNTPWKVESDAGWVHAAPLTGQDTGTVRLKVDPSEQPERNAVLRITSGLVRRTVTLKQFDWYDDGEVRVYREGDEENPIKLAFMGDGFTEEDLVVGGYYDEVMEEGIKALFSVEPYKTYRQYFCPYIVYVRSQERGISTKKNGVEYITQKNTALSLALIKGSTMIYSDMEKIEEYAEKVPGLTISKASICVVGNDSRVAGKSNLFPSGEVIALVLKASGGFYRNAVVHEMGGHGFGLLGDEYVDNVIGGDMVTEAAIKSLQSSYLWGANQNVVAEKNPQIVFWKDFIGRPGYERVGLIEGGFGYKRGIWRSEQNCCLRFNDLYFCIGCRLAIVKRIKAMTGEVFDLDDFIEKDVRKAP